MRQARECLDSSVEIRTLSKSVLVLTAIILGMFAARAIAVRVSSRFFVDVYSSSSCTTSGRLALVLVGRAPATAAIIQHRLSRWLNCAKWPKSIVCYATDENTSKHSLENSLWPLRHLAASACRLALVIPWDIDLCANWDNLLQTGISESHDECYSFCVPGCERMYQSRLSKNKATSLPLLTIRNLNLSFPIPDFRCLVGHPTIVAAYAKNWFPSFFAGLLVYPIKTTQLRLADDVSLAFDPIPGHAVRQSQEITPSDLATLMASGIPDAGQFNLDPFIWEILATRPSMHVRLPSDRVVLP